MRFRCVYPEKEGYFAYRLDCHLQTQAGRFNKDGKLEPWIFLHLSCQRYAQKRLVAPNYGRDISILMGMNEERLSGYDVDSTLVRLVIENSGKDKGNAWRFQLPELLAAFKARELEKPENILGNPAAFGNLDNLTNWCKKDEYYLVHAEGYEYEHENRKRGHSIKTGFSLQERGDITARVLELLNGVLIPDTPMKCDIPTPSGKKTPLAMRDYDFISTPPTFTQEEREHLSKEEKEQRIKERRQERQPIVANAIWRALQGKPMHLFLLWYEQDTYEVVCQQLRDAFILNDDEAFPKHVKVSPVMINDATLLEPLDTGGLSPKDGSNFDEQIRKKYQVKREAWRTFLQKHVTPLIDSDSNPYRFAIIEIGQSKKKGVHPRQSIYGAVREACVLEKISSQMVQTVKPSQTEKDDKNAPPSYSKKTKGRVINAVLDATLRQTGALYGLPSEVYEQAKIPKAIAQKLDVIALCRRKTIDSQGNIHYALAVRLQATGAVEVLLPNANDWILYARAGIEVGQLFSQGRRDRIVGRKRKRIDSNIQLTGTQLAQFAAHVLTQAKDRPTLILIEADGWRNERGEGDEDKIWFQLKNEYLLAKGDVLDFRHISGHTCEYTRDNDQLKNLLAVIRLRTGKETPQYITNRKAWQEDCAARDFIHLSGFYDTSVPELLHYFSVGRLPETQKAQDTATARELYMLDHHLHDSNSRYDEYGANIPFKHQQMVEMVPFFVHPNFQTEEGLKALCRVPHYLRFSPAWSMGNILQAYPMHLGQQLIEDHVCILGIEK